MKLILIRHGLTDFNLEKKYCGLTDIGLNKTGRHKLKVVRRILKGVKIDKVICSDLKRCYQTAKIIFDKRYRIKKNVNLREINFGKWEGFTYKEVSRKFPTLFRKWLRNPFAVKIPAGQHLNHFVNCIRKELNKIIRNNPDKTVALVTHLGVIRVILNDALGIKKKNFWRLRLSPEKIYIVEYDA